jgi:hypothetical protein
MGNSSLIGSIEAARILEIDRSQFNKYVAQGRIVPDLKMPGRTGVQLFTHANIKRFKRSLKKK